MSARAKPGSERLVPHNTYLASTVAGIDAKSPSHSLRMVGEDKSACHSQASLPQLRESQVKVDAETRRRRIDGLLGYLFDLLFIAIVASSRIPLVFVVQGFARCLNPVSAAHSAGKSALLYG